MSHLCYLQQEEQVGLNNSSTLSFPRGTWEREEGKWEQGASNSM